jgi:hypothetical protein
MESGGRSTQPWTEANADAQNVADHAEDVDQWANIEHKAGNDLLHRNARTWRRSNIQDHLLDSVVVRHLKKMFVLQEKNVRNID